MSDQVLARWVAPFSAFAPQHDCVLVPGETEVRVNRSEAEGSDHWEVVRPAKAKPTTTGEEGD